MVNLFGKSMFGKSLLGLDRSVSKRKSARLATRFGSEVENLEVRQVLTVNVAFTGGSLYLTGNAADNPTITFAAGPTNVTLSGATYTGNAGGAFLVTGSIFVNLSGDNNTVTLAGTGLFTGDVTINLGNGTNAVNVTDTVSIRDLKITGGSGTDTETIDGLTARNVIINNGTGDSTVAVGTTTAAAVNATGSFSITNLASGGAQATTFGTTATTTIAGGLTINQGAATTHGVSLTNTNVTAGGVTIINGTGTGTTTVDLTNVDATGDLKVINGNVTGVASDNSITIDTGSTILGNVSFQNGTAGNDNIISIDGSTFGAAGKSHSFTNAASTANSITLGDTAANTMTGAVTASNASSVLGTNTIDMWSGTINGNLSVTNNFGPTTALTNTITVGVQSPTGPAAGPVQVNGSVTLTNGKADIANGNTIAVSNLTTTLGGSLSTSNGTAGTSVTSIGEFGHNTIAGSLTATAYAVDPGNSRTTLIYNTAIAGAATISHQGTGQSNFNIGQGVVGNAVSVGGNFTITDGTNDSFMGIEFLTVGGKFNYQDAGGGVDTINIGLLNTSVITISGTTNINTGAGNDLVSISAGGGSVNIHFDAFLQITLGAGDDQLTVTDVKTGAAFGNNNFFQFDGGSGTDVWSLSSAVNGINGVDPLTSAVQAKLLSFEGPNIVIP